MRPSSFLSTIYPQWAVLQLESLTVVQQHLIFDVASRRRRARCPDCQRPSRRVHSRFTRLVADLPLAGFSVSLRLHGRQFRCLNRACPRQTFRERMPEIALPYQRRTPALRSRLEAVAFALGGQAGTRLVAHLQLALRGASRNSLLRLVRQAVLPGRGALDSPLRILGVDDFAFRRGVCYGAIVVNLEQQRNRSRVDHCAQWNLKQQAQEMPFRLDHGAVKTARLTLGHIRAAPDRDGSAGRVVECQLSAIR